MNRSAASGPPLRRDIVVGGASSGGVAALRQFVAALPADFGGAVFVVMHIAPQADGLLAGILDAAGPLPALRATDRMPVVAGRILVAPPDEHMLLEPGCVRVVHGPRENRHRPAIDPLFRSAAWSHGPRVAAVVLSGNLDDGTAGLWAVRSCGGVTVVQEPDEAEFPDMPRNALAYNRIDHRLPVRDIAALLARLARDGTGLPQPPQPPQPPPHLAVEVKRSLTVGDLSGGPPPGTPSPFTCPACGGALWEMDEDGHLRYRCHTGHGYSPATLLDEQESRTEESLYHAVRSMEEKSAALRRLKAHWDGRFPTVGKDYEHRAQELDRASDVLRSLLARQRG